MMMMIMTMMIMIMMIMQIMQIMMIEMMMMMRCGSILRHWEDSCGESDKEKDITDYDFSVDHNENHIDGDFFSL